MADKPQYVVIKATIRQSEAQAELGPPDLHTKLQDATQRESSRRLRASCQKQSCTFPTQ